MYAGYYQPYWTSTDQENELEHFGIKGMKWGIRRYQNPDGTLTELGKQRYGTSENLQADRQRKKEKAIKVAKVAAGVAATGIAVAGAGAGFKLATNAAFKIATSDLANGRMVSNGAKAILAIDKVLKDTKVNAIDSLSGALNIKSTGLKPTTKSNILNIKSTGFKPAKKSASAIRAQKQLEEAYREYMKQKRWRENIGISNIAEAIGR